MPEKRTIERARRDKRKGRSPTTQAGELVREEIHHVREGKHGARSTKQAIAIGLSKARRAGIELPPPEKASDATKKKAAADARAAKRKSTRRPSAARARAAKKALEREGTAAASPRALANQGRRAAKKRSATDRSRAAKKGALTKGPAVRKAAAKKAARTRARG